MVDQGFVEKVTLGFFGEDCLEFTLRRVKDRPPHQIRLFLRSRVEVVQDPKLIKKYTDEFLFLEKIVKQQTKNKIWYCSLEDGEINAMLYISKEKQYVWRTFELTTAQLRAYNMLVV